MLLSVIQGLQGFVTVCYSFPRPQHRPPPEPGAWVTHSLPCPLHKGGLSPARLQALSPIGRQRPCQRVPVFANPTSQSGDR